MRVQEETLLRVMQIRSLSCEKEEEAQIFIFLMLGCALQSIHYSQRSIASFFAVDTTQPRHICC